MFPAMRRPCRSTKEMYVRQPGTTPDETHVPRSGEQGEGRTWIQTRNDNPRPYVWTKTADQIIESVANYYNELTTRHTRSDLHLHSRGGRLG
jgi:hypothetical protein